MDITLLLHQIAIFIVPSTHFTKRLFVFQDSAAIKASKCANYLLASKTYENVYTSRKIIQESCGELFRSGYKWSNIIIMEPKRKVHFEKKAVYTILFCPVSYM